MNSRIRKFFSYYRPYRGLFAAVLACAAVSSIIALLIPQGVRHITKNILESGLDNALSQIYLTGAGMAALLLIWAACTYVYDAKGHGLGAMMESDMRKELFDHYQKLSFGFYDNEKPGKLMSRLTNDLLSLAEFYHHAPENIALYLTKFIGAFVILLFINVRLTLIVFAFLPVMVVFTLYMGKKLYKAFEVNLECIADVNAQVEENLSGIRVVQSFTGEDTEKKKFVRANGRFLESRQSIYRHESYLDVGVRLLTQLVTVSVAVFGGAGIVRASLDLADLITFLLYVGYLVEPIPMLAFMVKQYQEGFASFNRFMEIIDLKPEVEDAKDAIEPGAVRGNVEFRNVGFKYREDGQYVLRNVSLRVGAGEYVAFVGSSGVGKTTLCSLVPRFYDVSEGSVLVDGVDVRKLRVKSLRENVGVVQQDVYLFAGTVLDNIRYGRPDASADEVIAAAKLANAHEFIQALPNGYDTDIGHRGVKLSGGQKQRISIARVFLKNPPILILDEATSSLDNESERVIQDSLESLAKNRTTFVIAHRLSTIRNAGRIVVLSDQGIDEQGTHEELMRHNGTYAHLYNIQ